jgi:hypothetical protein
MKMDQITTYRYADFSKIDEWDADELMAALCDLPVEVEVIQLPEPTVQHIPIAEPSPRTSTRTSETLQRLQADVEKMRYFHLQQAEEIYFLKSKIEKLEEQQKKNINLTKRICHGQGQRVHSKKSNTTDISSANIDYTRQIKSRRFEKSTQRDIP